MEAVDTIGIKQFWVEMGAYRYTMQNIMTLRGYSG
jgi:hypothetical protein